MASDLQQQQQAGSDTSVTGLVTGIISDAQELFKQQVALLKHEFKDDLRKTVQASVSLAAGGIVAAVGALMLCLMLVHLLTWAFGPENLPLWASYAIVGATFGVVGAVLVYAGKKKFDSFNPLPDETAQALKENVQWIMKPK